MVQKKIRLEIRKAKLDYRERLEGKFQAGNMKDAWKGLKILTGQNKSQQTTTMSKDDRIKHANSLNDFYCRFERDDLEDKLFMLSVRKELNDKIVSDTENTDFVIHSSVVEPILRKQNVNKAVGPDRISGKLVKTCAAQLSYVFSMLFSWSHRVCTVRLFGKTLSLLYPNQKKQKN